MVQKSERRRGRPRSYDGDTVLGQALETFARAGFSATSLDELSAATGLNRPSLYGAFGDKRALYVAALTRYRAGSRATIEESLSPDRSLKDGLTALYARALASYLATEPAQGCFLIGTAVTEAVGDEEVRELLGESLREFERLLVNRFNLAREAGEISPAADPEALGALAGAVLHSLAIRSRAGDPRQALERLAEAGVNMLCGR
jgi:AcrR family transcriptional regulator